MFSIDNILNGDILNGDTAKFNDVSQSLENKINNIITQCINRDKYQKMYDKDKIIVKCDKLTNKSIRKVFDHIDKHVFGNVFNEFINHNTAKCYIGLTKKKTCDTTVGYFFANNTLKNETYGIKISKDYFENIINNNILNIDLGSVDESNENVYSKTIYDPLIITIEHEMIHMLMYIGKLYSHPIIIKDKNIKSGHTPLFRKLVYNIFGQKRMTHVFDIGDIKIINSIKDSINLGDYVTNQKIKGYIVCKNKDHAIIYTGEDYVLEQYDKLSIIYNYTVADKKYNISYILKKLKIGMDITYCGKMFKIVKINNKTVCALALNDNILWCIHKFRALEFIFY